MKISVVTSLYKSGPYIEELHRRAVAAIAETGAAEYEIIFVNDGSPDDGLAIAKGIAIRDPNVIVIDLARNFGQHRATITGLTHATGDYISGVVKVGERTFVGVNSTTNDHISIGARCVIGSSSLITKVLADESVVSAEPAKLSSVPSRRLKGFSHTYSRRTGSVKPAGKSIAILHSNYIPWKGYFDIIASVDEFLILDDVQFTRRDWRNRNKIVLAGKVHWLTIPVRSKGSYNATIEAIEIADGAWAQKHWMTAKELRSEGRELHRGC